MDPIKMRKGFAIRVIVEPHELDKELDEEGKAPSLKEVDGEQEDNSVGTPEDDMEEELMKGDERDMSQRMAKGNPPRGLGDRVKMEMLKKRVTKE